MGAPPRGPRPGHPGAAAVPLRGGADHPAGARAPSPGAAGAGRPTAHRGRGTAGGLRRAAPLRAHRRSAAGGCGDRGRPGTPAPDEPPAPGRGRLGQDARGAARDAARGRLRRPGRAPGAHRGPRPAAPPLAQRHARRPRGRWDARRAPGGDHPGAADRVDDQGAAHRAAAAARLRRGRPGRRHPRPARGRRPVRRPRPGRGRRAAPLRRRAAGGADRQGGHPAARPGDDRDADPAHGRDDRLRRPGDLHALRAPGRPRTHPDDRGPARGRPALDRAGLAARPRGGGEGPPGLRRLPAHLRRRHRAGGGRRPRRRGGDAAAASAGRRRGGRRRAGRGPARRAARRAPARAAAGGGEGPHHARLRRR